MTSNAEKETKAVATVQEKTITDEVMTRINTLTKNGELQLPKNYSIGNALKSAWLILQETLDKDKRPVLQTCSKPSIANALLNMAIQGLNPIKKQCYFVAYGKHLTLMRSYMGTIAVAKRLKGVKNVFANCIYDGDEFAYELDLNTGLKKITKHEQKFEDIDITKIKGAYAVIVRDGADPYVEIMNMNQIRNSWNQGAAKGKSGAHQNFTDEMAKKTVINRACKLFVNTTDDSDVLVGAINNTTEHTDEETIEDVDYSVAEEVQENANKQEIDIQPDAKEEVKQPIKETKAEAKAETKKEPEQISMNKPGF